MTRPFKQEYDNYFHKNYVLFFNFKLLSCGEQYQMFLFIIILFFLIMLLSLTQGLNIEFLAMVPYSSLRNLAIKVNPVPYARSMSVLRASKLKKDAAKDHANDGTGKHTHVVEERCIQTDCNKKKCPVLCDQPSKDNIKGHNTHRIPIGRFRKYIAEEDASGNSKPQYFVSTNKPHIISPQEKEAYGDQIKSNPIQQKFIEKYANKYDNK